MANKASLKPFKKGKDPRRNLKGRPVGSKDFKTLYREAIIKLAKADDKDPLEYEMEIVAKGLALARKGDHRFYKDTLDRLHGKAKETHKLEGSFDIKALNKAKKKKLQEIIDDK